MSRSYEKYEQALRWDDETIGRHVKTLRSPDAIGILSWISEYRVD